MKIGYQLVKISRYIRTNTLLFKFSLERVQTYKFFSNFGCVSTGAAVSRELIL